MDAIAQVPKTALDIYRMLPEGTRCEVINNALYMTPTPDINHQDILMDVVVVIWDWVNKMKLGKTIIAPGVYFEDLLSAVQPDVIFISNDQMHIIKEDAVYGAPDLVIEVLSSDKKRDTVMKKELYEKAGVKEYFIVDPATKQLTRFDHQSGSFIMALESVGEFHSEILGLTFSF